MASPMKELRTPESTLVLSVLIDVSSSGFQICRGELTKDRLQTSRKLSLSPRQEALCASADHCGERQSGPGTSASCHLNHYQH